MMELKSMSDTEHLLLLKQGVEIWNQWREENPQATLDFVGADLSGISLIGASLREANFIDAKLSGANLSKSYLSWAKLGWAILSDANLSETDLKGADFRKANLSRANLIEAEMMEADLRKVNLSGAILRGANLTEANLKNADLRGADLQGAYLVMADLNDANLEKANLTGANLTGADFSEANLSGAVLTGANLSRTILVDTNLTQADLTGCRVYGMSAWNVNLAKTTQGHLIIGKEDEVEITVDNLEVAQFIYLILNNQKIRQVIDTVTSKAVLILGRFTEERKRVLDAIKHELRKRDYLPIIFDFDKPTGRDLTETVQTLAHMAKLVIADITDAKSIPQELRAIVPNLPSLPVQPIILDSQYEYAMFKDFAGYLSVDVPFRYRDIDHLLANLEDQIITPATKKAQEIDERRKKFEAQLGR